MMRKRTHQQYMDEQREKYEQELETVRAEYYDQAYKQARDELKKILRELFVDVNYELFSTPQGLLRAKVNGFMTTGLAYFHERSEK
jgi:hypothetical protein